MTALAGICSSDARANAGDACRKMLAAQQLYGVHETHCWDDGFVALGRALFRTLPEDAYDGGAIDGGGGRLRLVADVRLDNREELCAALGIEPARARTLADASVLLAAWERWGEGALDRLIGDYAFAIWDSANRVLILARDPIGMRPLHYHQGSGFVAFASMPKGLHALPEIPRLPDELRAAELLALIPEHGQRSFFADVSRVEQGEIVRFGPEGVARRRFWRPARPDGRRWRAGEAEEALREKLDEAVRARLRGAGGCVGAHLSAGLDSSAVASTAARLLAPSGGRVAAFTAVPRRGFTAPEMPRSIPDEGALAAATAALHPNIEHVVMPGRAGDPLAELDRDLFLSDRPPLNPVNHGWWNAINAEAQARGIGVVLTGAFGNMSLSYGRPEQLADFAAAGRWPRALREAGALVRSGRIRVRRAAAILASPWLPPALLARLRRRPADPVEELFRYSLLRRDQLEALGLDAAASARKHDFGFRRWAGGFEDRLYHLRRADPGNLNKAALGGWGVDLRDPATDRRLIEFCLSLPTEALLAGGETRPLALRVLADRLPPEVLSERRKGYQAADWHEGMSAARDTLLREVERLEAVPAAARTIDLPRMRRLIAHWPSTGWENPDTVAAYRLALPRAAVVGHFLRSGGENSA